MVHFVARSRVEAKINLSDRGNFDENERNMCSYFGIFMGTSLLLATIVGFPNCVCLCVVEKLNT